MLLKSRTLEGIKGEIFMYFFSKAPLPGTDMYGPFSGPFYVSREYANLCKAKGYDIKVVDPEKDNSVIIKSKKGF